MLRRLLQGRPFNHPLHTFLVHFPIGLFALSFLFDVGSLVFNMRGLVQGAFAAMFGGFLFGLLAAAPGLADFFDVRRSSPARRTALWHMILNIAMLCLYAVNLGLRYTTYREALTTPWLPFLLSLAAIVLLGISGYLGGSLVYDHGVGVGRHRRDTALPQDTIAVHNAEPGSFVPVAQAQQLADGESLHLDLNGTLIALIRSEGEFYAVQDFCSHRYGPLSEGRICDAKVECPWHRSCFDLRTGEVVEGPAKVNLRTFPTRLENGKVLVRVPTPA